VSGPFFNLSSPEPTGVVAVLAPREPLLGLISVVAPVIATGNTAVVLASEPHPIPAVTMTEVMAASDVPGGVVNVLTGSAAEIGPWLASHMDVNAIDLAGIDDVALAAELERLAAENLKRVLRPRSGSSDWQAAPGTERLAAFVETKTVWHPIGT
jgi:acyl-CoA reductase-like NAD-dependent aldehyde dehydrogenase